MENTKTPFLPAELMAELREAAQVAASAIRDPEVMKKARARMIQMRKEIFRKHGLLDIGVPAIRELRDGKDA
jgi:hypothetical protein